MAKSFLSPSMRPDPTYAVRVATIEGALEEYLGQITRDAAKGIHAAQSEAASYALLRATVPAWEGEALVGAEVFARLAAEHGETGDILRLSGVLMKRAVELCGRDDRRARSFAGEAFVLLEGLWLSNRSPVLLEGAVLLNASDDETDAILFDAVIEAVQPATAKAINDHVKTGGKK
jgi:hypothetical protein